MKPRTETDLKDLCRGCPSDRYNHKGLCERPGIDHLVDSDKCWCLSLAKLEHIRRGNTRVWYMRCNSAEWTYRLRAEQAKKDSRGV